MENLIIQKAVSEDIESVGTIYQEAIDWLTGQNIHQWQSKVYPTKDTAQAALEQDCLYVCLKSHQRVGTFIINEFQWPQYQSLPWKYPGPAMVLHTLVISPGFTGRGIGRAVVEYVMGQARKNNYDCIRLDVFPGNQGAVGLYRSLGFEFVGKVFFEIKEPGYEWYDCYEKKL